MFDFLVPEQARIQNILPPMLVITRWAAFATALLLSILFGVFRLAPLGIFAGVALFEWLVVEASLWAWRNNAKDLASGLYVIGTIIISGIVSFVIQFFVFLAATAIMMPMLGILMVGKRLGVLAGIIGWLWISLYQLLLQRIDVLAQPWILNPSNQIVGIVHGLLMLITVILTVLLLLVVQRTVLQNFTLYQDQYQNLMLLQDKQYQLAEKLEQEYTHQQRLLAAVEKLEVPLIFLQDTVVLLPLVGHLTAERWERIQQQILQGIYTQGIRNILIDIGGVTGFDAQSLKYLMQLGQSAQLIGSRIALTGISSDVARLLAEYDLQAAGLRSFAAIDRALTAI